MALRTKRVVVQSENLKEAERDSVRGFKRSRTFKFAVVRFRGLANSKYKPLRISALYKFFAARARAARPF
jgi:hypothetical protein